MEFPAEEPDDAARAEARRNKSGWVYKIESDYGPDDYVPQEAIVGAWRVNSEGEIVGKFIPNPNFGGMKRGRN